jgi:hypothetical protein
MKYLLGLGFFIKERYKKNPRVRLFIDQTFIDEFDITTNAKNDHEWLSDSEHWIHKKQEEDWIWFNRRKNYGENESRLVKQKNQLTLHTDKDFPDGIRCYLLDQELLKRSNKIKCEVYNNDTNNTNGFMSRSTLLDLSQIFLLPCRYIDFFRKKERKDLRCEFNSKIVPPMCRNSKDPNERNYKLILYDYNLHGRSGDDQGYPFRSTCFWDDKVCQWPENIGGSGVLTLDLHKNHQGMIILQDPTQKNKEYYDYDHKVAQWAFPVSAKFFSIAEKIMVDKYLR